MTTYKIKAGDTLTSIAKMYNTTVDSIAKANNITNKNLIYAGDTLTIPPANVTVSADGISVVSTPYYSAYKTGGAVSDEIKKDVESWEKKKPAEHKSLYDDEIFAMLDKLERAEFSYDPFEDDAYKLMYDEGRRKASLAMEDTLGKALTKTGGYANSYALGAAQQAYAGTLGEMSDYIPELYSAAYDRFSDERDALMDSIELLRNMDDEEFDQYVDMMKLYLSEGEMLWDNYKDVSKEEFDRFIDYTALIQKAAKA